MEYGILVLEKLIERIEAMSVLEYEKLFDETITQQTISVCIDNFIGEE